jgi:hypothetical protein
MRPIADKECVMTSDAWTDVLEYLRRLGANDLFAATDLLDHAIDRDGIGSINDALADACRSLMDRVIFPAGTVDIHAVVDTVALRVIDTSGDARPEAIDRQRSLLVFLGSEGLPCAARNDVASWSAVDRLHDSIACVIGLVGIVSTDTHTTLADTVAAIAPPGPTQIPEGTFGLAWRGPNSAEPFAGVVPRGYTAHITFLGANECSLRSIFARVAMLRNVKLPIEIPNEELVNAPIPR